MRKGDSAPEGPHFRFGSVFPHLSYIRIRPLPKSNLKESVLFLNFLKMRRDSASGAPPDAPAPGAAAALLQKNVMYPVNRASNG